jgi:DNA-binding HxlR family transcriptional regulator
MKQKAGSIASNIQHVQNTLNILSGKWKLPILMSMYDGKSRFRDLQRCIPAITTRVLSKELKDLESNKLIVRTVHNTHPVTVAYTLTSYSHTLAPVVDELVKWGKQHSKSIV